MTDYALGDRGTVEVITNDFYDDEILQVFEELQVDREKMWTGEARLVPEPDNPYEPNSIAVYIDDLKVGRLSPENSREYWKPITRVVASGYVPIAHFQLSAVLRTEDGQNNIESQGLLNLSPSGSLFPLNQAPTQAALLPQGPSLKVLDEKDYSEYLHSILPPSGEGRVILTLEANQLKQGNGALVDSVEVFHDRKRVGRLSTQMSEQLAPVIRYAFERNKLTSAWGTIRGNSLELSLTVQAVRPSDLDQEWFEELPNNVPDLVETAESYDVPDAYQPTDGETNRQNTAPKKKRGLVGSLASSPASTPEETSAATGSVARGRSLAPDRRLPILLAIVGALILIGGIFAVMWKPLLGVVGLVLGASLLFLALAMDRTAASRHAVE